MSGCTQPDLLTYVPEPVANPLPPPVPPPPAALLWWEAREAYYFGLMVSFMNGRCSLQVRQHEIKRVNELRNQAMARIREIRGEDDG